MIVWFGVGLLGGAGAIARYLLDEFVSERTGLGPPFGTLAVNLAGALALGVVSGAHVAGDALLLAGTAGLGSFTTFSAWMFESQRLGEEGARKALAANVFVSLFAGLAAVALGRALGGAL